jgi:hypothetical protein
MPLAFSAVINSRVPWWQWPVRLRG